MGALHEKWGVGSLFFVDLDCVCVCCTGAPGAHPDAGEVEPALKLTEVGEDVREDEVQQRPQLREVVLQRRAGEQQLVRRGDGAQLADEHAVVVLQAVPLVHNQ
eukprot:419025-Pyramimonas_sp.AAC.1